MVPEHALAGWSAAVGGANVETTPSVLDAAARATYATSHRPLAIVRPGSVAEVQACVRVAAGSGVPLWPLSTGKNWGYGSRVPGADGAVILDLGRLDRIVRYDAEMGYVTVEPGVTQARLHAFLADHGGTHWLDATGSTPDASLIGNVMERGFGVTPYGDHVGRATGYEVVLADGSLLHTGFGAWPGARTAAFDRWAPGPSLEGLFSQTGLGIVTKLSVALMPRPEGVNSAFLDIHDEQTLARAIDAMRRLQLEGTVRSAPWFGNVYRLLGVVMRFPWSTTAPPLRLDQAHSIGRRAGIPPWTGTFAIYGTDAQLAAARDRVRHVLEPVGVQPTFVDTEALRSAPSTGRRSVEHAMHRGYTGGLINAVRRAYWRKRTPPGTDADLDADGVGFIFVNASVPFRGADVVEAARIAEEVVIEAGFEPSLSCHSIRERALVMLMTVSYDRDLPGEDERARAMHDALAERWMAEGWPPFRLGLHSMHLYERAEPVHRQAVEAITHALDPAGVLSPGRYRGP